MSPLTGTLIGLIVGLLLGFLAFIVIYRAILIRMIVLFVKRQEQAMSVGSRYANKMSDEMLDDLLDNSLHVGPFDIPLGAVVKESLPGLYKGLRKKIAQNPQATWFAIGQTVGPFILGAAMKRAQAQKGEGGMIELLSNAVPVPKMLNPQKSILDYGPEKVPPVQQAAGSPPTEAKTHGTQEDPKPINEVRGTDSNHAGDVERS